MDTVLMLKALADETRWEIIQLLKCNNLCACQLLDAFDISQATLSYHMRLLQEASLVQGIKEGYWTRYYLNKENLAQLVYTFDELLEERTVSSPPIQCSNKNKGKLR